MSTENASKLVYMKHNMDKVPQYEILYKEYKMKVTSGKATVALIPEEHDRGEQLDPEEQFEARFDDPSEDELEDFFGVSPEQEAQAPVGEENVDEDAVLGYDNE